MPFKEIIAVYSENHMTPTNTLCEQNAECRMLKRVVYVSGFKAYFQEKEQKLSEGEQQLHSRLSGD
jgi:hypothetical protein